MAIVNALLFVPRLLGVLVGTVLWIVAVPLIELGRGVVQALRSRSGEKPSARTEPEPKRIETTSERRAAFDPTRVRPIWTASHLGRAPTVAKDEERSESDEERRAS